MMLFLLLLKVAPASGNRKSLHPGFSLVKRGVSGKGLRSLFSVFTYVVWCFYRAAAVYVYVYLLCMLTRFMFCIMLQGISLSEMWLKFQIPVVPWVEAKFCLRAVAASSKARFRFGAVALSLAVLTLAMII